MKYLKNIKWKGVKEDLMKIPLKTILMLFVVMGLICAWSLKAEAYVVTCGMVINTDTTCNLVVNQTSDLDCSGGDGIVLQNAHHTQGCTIEYDCNGHSIQGSRSPYTGSTYLGIRLNGGDIEVRNCTIEGFDEGIGLYWMWKPIIHSNILRDNETAIVIREHAVGGTAYGAEIHSNIFVNNDMDLLDYRCDACKFWNNYTQFSRVSFPNSNSDWTFDVPIEDRPNILGYGKVSGNYWGYCSPPDTDMFCPARVIFTDPAIPIDYVDNHPLYRQVLGQFIIRDQLSCETAGGKWKVLTDDVCDYECGWDGASTDFHNTSLIADMGRIRLNGDINNTGAVLDLDFDADSTPTLGVFTQCGGNALRVSGKATFGIALASYSTKGSYLTNSSTGDYKGHQPRTGVRVHGGPLYLRNVVGMGSWFGIGDMGSRDLTVEESGFCTTGIAAIKTDTPFTERASYSAADFYACHWDGEQKVDENAGQISIERGETTYLEGVYAAGTKSGFISLYGSKVAYEDVFAEDIGGGDADNAAIVAIGEGTTAVIGSLKTLDVTIETEVIDGAVMMPGVLAEEQVVKEIEVTGEVAEEFVEDAGKAASIKTLSAVEALTMDTSAAALGNPKSYALDDVTTSADGRVLTRNGYASVSEEPGVQLEVGKAFAKGMLKSRERLAGDMSPEADGDRIHMEVGGVNSTVKAMQSFRAEGERGELAAEVLGKALAKSTGKFGKPIVGELRAEVGSLLEAAVNDGVGRFKVTPQVSERDVEIRFKALEQKPEDKAERKRLLALHEYGVEEALAMAMEEDVNVVAEARKIKQLALEAAEPLVERVEHRFVAGKQFTVSLHRTLHDEPNKAFARETTYAMMRSAFKTPHQNNPVVLIEGGASVTGLYSSGDGDDVVGTIKEVPFSRSALREVIAPAYGHAGCIKQFQLSEDPLNPSDAVFDITYSDDTTEQITLVDFENSAADWGSVIRDLPKCSETLVTLLEKLRDKWLSWNIAKIHVLDNKMDVIFEAIAAVEAGSPREDLIPKLDSLINLVEAQTGERKWLTEEQGMESLDLLMRAKELAQPL